MSYGAEEKPEIFNPVLEFCKETQIICKTNLMLSLI